MHRFSASDFALAESADITVHLEDAPACRRLGAIIGTSMRDGGFIGLVGNLGAGKTTFVQGVVTAFGGTGATSPTYTLLNEYETSPRVSHLDLYRLERFDDLENIGYWDALDPDALVIVEWIDRFADAWVDGGVLVRLEHAGPARTASIWAQDAENLRRALADFDVV